MAEKGITNAVYLVTMHGVPHCVFSELGMLRAFLGMTNTRGIAEHDFNMPYDLGNGHSIYLVYFDTFVDSGPLRAG